MKRILIVEDNPIWSKILVDYCSQLGFGTVVVNSPQTAMDALDEFRPVVIILDMLLATETGMALLGEMRGYEDLSDVPIIVCSSVSGIDLERLRSFGVKYVFDKAIVEPIDIKSAIRSILDE